MAAKRKLDYEAFRAAETAKFIAGMPAVEHESLVEAHRRKNRAMLTHLTAAELEEITSGTVRSEILHSGRVPLPTLEEYSKAFEISL